MPDAAPSDVAPVRRLTAPQARRLALAAQGFGSPPATVTARHLRLLFRRVGLLQLDSVNVLCRSHYLPAYSRFGPYDTTLLDRMAGNRDPAAGPRGLRPRPEQRELVEYWCHEASLLPVDDLALFRFRMDRAHDEAWSGFRRVRHEQPELVAEVKARVEAEGPLPAGAFESTGRAKGGSWWNRSEAKAALEYLFWAGEISARRVTGSFTREYGGHHQMWPARVRRAVDQPLPPPAAMQALLLKAAGHLGVATAADLADYHRLHGPTARGLVAELVEQGALAPAIVEGWREPAYLLPGTVVPRRSPHHRALLSPFDSLVWFRPRTERLWNFHYRLEFYVPAPKRIYGYYVMPFLLGEDLVGRVDVKADRPAGVLRVGGAWAETGADPAVVAPELGTELGRLARFLGLSEWEAQPRGNLGELLAGRSPGIS